MGHCWTHGTLLTSSWDTVIIDSRMTWTSCESQWTFRETPSGGFGARNVDFLQNGFDKKKIALRKCSWDGGQESDIGDGGFDWPERIIVKDGTGSLTVCVLAGWYLKMQITLTFRWNVSVSHSFGSSYLRMCIVRLT